MKKLQLLIHYFILLKRNKKVLTDRHNLKFDWIGRFYKTHVVSKDKWENIKLHDYPYLREDISSELRTINSSLIDLGMNELTRVQEIITHDKYQATVIFGYRFINLKNFFNFLLKTITLLLIFGISLIFTTLIISSIITGGILFSYLLIIGFKKLFFIKK
jgi:hypothetical protein